MASTIETYVFYVLNTYVKFYYVVHVPNLLNSHVSLCQSLMGLTFLIGISKSNFTSVSWILILPFWKRNLLILLMFIRMIITSNIKTTLPKTKSFKEKVLSNN
ncbi:hypothetical protein CR513_04876, partial [Mucuna pruriens]